MTKKWDWIELEMNMERSTAGIEGWVGEWDHEGLTAVQRTSTSVCARVRIIVNVVRVP